MFNKNYLLVVLLSSVSIAFAEEDVTLNPDRPEEYIVQEGDTLWDISGRFLQEPWRWTEVWEGNPHIENPHLIFPGDVVSLVFKDGQPVLTVNGASVDDATHAAPKNRDVKLSPTVRAYPHVEEVRPIPVDAIWQFLRRIRIVQEKEMDEWPYILSIREGHLMASVGDTVYIRGLPGDVKETRYSIYRQGKALVNELKNPEKILGHEASYIGSIVIRRQGEPATGVVVSALQEILSGDRLIPESEEDASGKEYIPSVPQNTIDANILSVIDDPNKIGRYQIVAIDAGTDHGVEVGNVLAIYRSGEHVEDRVATGRYKTQNTVRNGGSGIGYDNRSAFNRELNLLIEDIKSLKDSFNFPDLITYWGRPGAHDKQVFVELPSEYIGTLMTFQVFDGLSYGLVMRAYRPIHLFDSVGN